MPIICLEGASAVGKTTTCGELKKRYGAYIIPEVNLLFKRPLNESKTWYLERQVERWTIAKEKLQTHDLVVLDGDIYQPLSYNWCFDFQVFGQTLELLNRFYRGQLTNKLIGLPDKYFYLHTTVSNLKEQKENDITRTRGNFEKHLGIINSHKKYYQSLNDIIPSYTEIIEAQSIENNIKEIIQTSNSLSKSPTYRYSVEKFDCIIDWLNNNKA